ncbi:MAG: hypothetical protein WBC37_18835 [Burkholderiaceae bacterium]
MTLDPHHQRTEFTPPLSSTVLQHASLSARGRLYSSTSDIGNQYQYSILEDAGALRSSQTVVAGKTRRCYRTTKAGDAMLKELRLRTREFVDEVLATPRARVVKRPLKRVA